MWTRKRALAGAAASVMVASSIIAAPLSVAAESGVLYVRTDSPVQCEVRPGVDGLKIVCTSPTDEAYEAMPTCAKEDGVPGVLLAEGRSDVVCWNKEPTAAEKVLLPGETVVMNHYLLWADNAGGLHVATDVGEYGYVGPAGAADYAPGGINFTGSA
ncbi:hypothetical protein [Corynebacterium uterequi]|uniref:Secreted protein n=1 Tax=Corynebacterium uterequi TaxID=1072256 RepID=A0A0G3HE43_9CORY|nr:hypothetical protein [Corynebacterium uterequi]AKK11010.1 hypothetical protein CUTER_05045 [Corynebacterium uterequi]